MVIGITVHPTTTITSGDGGTTYAVKDGAAFAYTGSIAFASDVNLTNTVTSGLPKYYQAASNVTLNCDGGKTFNAGVVRVTVHYISLDGSYILTD